MSDGLHMKYSVDRLNDEAGKHDDCEYFVLDPKHDPHARIALAAYIGCVMRAGQFRFAKDLVDLLERTEGESSPPEKP